MATVNFEVKSYEVKIARELNTWFDTVCLKFPGYIAIHGDEYHAVVYALDDTSPVPDNKFDPTYKMGQIFVPRWQFEWFLDLVRNEKPVYCYLDSDTPRWNALYTGKAPAGELEH